MGNSPPPQRPLDPPPKVFFVVERVHTLSLLKNFLFSLYFFYSLWYTFYMRYNYVNLYNKNASFLEERPKVKKLLPIANTALTYLFFIAYALLFVYGATEGEFAPMDFVKVFCAPALALIIVSVLRLAIDRPRPYAEDGAGIVPLKEKEGDKNSFPSRHLTSAAVIAAIFLPYLPTVSAGLFLLSFVLGYLRFALGWHYPSDLFIGFVLGLVVGIIPMFL